MGNGQVSIVEFWQMLKAFLNDDSEISSDDVIRNSGMPEEFIGLLTEKESDHIKKIADAMYTHNEETPKKSKRKSNNAKPKMKTSEIPTEKHIFNRNNEKEERE